MDGKHSENTTSVDDWNEKRRMTKYGLLFFAGYLVSAAIITSSSS
jgi:hypothetical protein